MSVHQSQFLKRKTRADAESNRGPSAHQPNALPLAKCKGDWSPFQVRSQTIENALSLCKLTCLHGLTICTMTESDWRVEVCNLPQSVEIGISRQSKSCTIIYFYGTSSAIRTVSLYLIVLQLNNKRI